MSLLGAGAGAAEGLDAVLARELAQQKFQQEQKEHADEMTLKSRSLDQSGAAGLSEAQLRAAQTQKILEDRANAESERKKREALSSDPTVPQPQKDFIRADDAGVKMPFELISPTPHNPPAPGPIKDIQGVGLTRIGPDGKPQPILGEDGKTLQQYHPPVQPSLAQGDGGFFLVPHTPGAQAVPVPMKDGTQLQSKPAASVSAQSANKETGLKAVDRLSVDIDEAAAAGLVGPASGRLYDTFAKVGSTGDPTKDRIIGRLKGDLLLTKMHVDAGIGGARAAASPLLLQRWEDLAMKSSPDLMKGYLSGIADDMKGDHPPPGTAPSTSTVRHYDPVSGTLK